jgi:hypothetical protein
MSNRTLVMVMFLSAVTFAMVTFCAGCCGADHPDLGGCEESPPVGVCCRRDIVDVADGGETGYLVCTRTFR